MSYKIKWNIEPEQVGQLFEGLQSVAKRFIMANFRKQGFQDGGLKAWKPKKKNDGRNILVGKSNPHMIQSFHFDKLDKTSTRITNSKKYSGIHNEGGKISKASVSRVLSFTNKSGVSRFAKSGSKSITHQSRSTFKAHDITMPERRMIGESKTLDLMIDRDVARRMKKLFKK